MAFRRVLLRIMLWSLGFAAVIGALAMLFFQAEMIWRIVGTAVATGIGSGLMLAFSVLSERQKTRNVGVLGMATVVAEFLLTLLVIWMPYEFGFSYRFFDEVLQTAGAIAAGAIPAMIALRLAEEPGARPAGWMGVALSVLIFLMLITAAWASSYPAHQDKLGTSALALALFGGLAVISLVGAGRDRRYWRYLGVLAAAAGCVIAFVGIWRELRGGSSLTIVSSLAVTVALANMVMLCPLKAGQTWLAYATIAAAAFTALFVDLTAIYNPQGRWDLLYRLAGAFGILSACGCLALGVLHRLNRRFDLKPSGLEITRFTLVCPACGKKQTLSTGHACCDNCGLLIHMRFEEPRCPNCDYLLYMLKADRCPECGTPIHRSAGAITPCAAQSP